MTAKLKIGTSGYSYPDWRGVFYPESLPTRDFIRYYKRYFQTLELNYTFYKMPDRKTISRLMETTDGQVTFSVKAHQQYTHHENQENPLEGFFSALSPMIDNKLLQCILFQFPFKFRKTTQNCRKCEDISRSAQGLPIVFEFRHRSWLNAETFKFLALMNAGFCSVDQPNITDLPGSVSALTGKLGYVRFHGKNAEKWWNHNESWERYDYLYRPKDLGSWVDIIRSMKSKTETVCVYFNNHYMGQAIRGAQLLMAFMND
jgi:uncharacterized protein YecE (DUF72 family)